MERLRKPWEGTRNIVRFNWPFFVGAAAGVGGLLLAAWLSPLPWRWLLVLGAGGVTVVAAVSLLVSCYVYDASGLYELGWLDAAVRRSGADVVTIHAGFDESSHLLARYLRPATLTVLDFYDPMVHTEASIRRARQVYPAYPGTQVVSTRQLPLPSRSADLVVLLLAAHEIRQEVERVVFLREVRRLLRSSGRVVVVEHLRDAANLMAYSLGAFHFYSRRSWYRVFGAAGLRVQQEARHTPFITVFTLGADDATA